MKLLVDMNLSPEWVGVLKEAGWESVHWSSVGDPRALDSEIMAWAKQRGHVVFTHDLDFGSLLALTQAKGQVSSRSAHRMWRRQPLQRS